MARRLLISLGVFGLLAQGAAAQFSTQPIQWLNQPGPASNAAQRALKPILIYVTGDAESRNTDLDNRQQRVLRDPTIVGLVNAKFVPLRLARNTQTLPVMKQLGLPYQYGMYLAVLPPDALASPQTSTKLALIEPTTITDAGTLTMQLVDANRQYGAQLYGQQIKPLFEQDEIKVADLNKALQVIVNFNVAEADQTLLKLVDEKITDKTQVRNIYDALALLSTRAAADKLLEKAQAGDAAAKQALSKLTPEAAEMVLLDELRSENPEERYLAYQALVKIFNIKPIRNEKWWERIRENERDEELARIRGIVTNGALQWKQTIGRFR